MGAEESVSVLHPAHRYYRFLFLALLCFMTFGSYWCYDIPDAIQTQMTNKFNLTPTRYALLYSVYNFMNIVIVLFGGYFIDVIGLRIGSILFCFLITLGQVVFSFGSSLSNNDTAYIVMLAGRIIFSLGGESLSVAQSTFTSKWFKGNELAFAFGITLSFARIGSFANLNITPVLAKHWGVSWAVWAGSVTCLVSLALTVWAAYSDRVRDRHLNAAAAANSEPEKPAIPFKFSDILHFPASLWLIYIICVCYYVPIFTTVSISGVPYLENALGYTDGKSNHFLSIPYMMSGFLAPFCGFAVDKIGRKPVFLSISSAFMVGTFSILLYALPEWPHSYTLIVAVVLLGLSYSICASSLWPCVPLLVPEERVGTAYAIMNSIQNGGLALAGVVVARLATCKKGVSALDCTTRPIEFLGLVAIVATGFSILLAIYDLSHGKVLSAKSSKAAEVTEIQYSSDEKSPLLPTTMTVSS